MPVTSALPFSLPAVGTIHGYTAVLSRIKAIQAPFADRCLQVVVQLVSSAMIGIKLGFLGAILVACAIPILACIPRLPQ